MKENEIWAGKVMSQEEFADKIINDGGFSDDEETSAIIRALIMEAFKESDESTVPFKEILFRKLKEHEDKTK